jgi:hypothetical protein
MNGNCKQVKADGAQCSAKAMGGSPFCFFHDPNSAQRRQEARERGGHSKLIRIPPEMRVEEPVDLQTANDVRVLLSDTITRLRRGQLDCKVSSTIGYLAQIGLRAIEQHEIEDRLTRIEEKLGLKC